MLSKIKVYGRLARFLGERSFEAEISTPLHAFKFLLANFPEVEKHMMEQSFIKQLQQCQCQHNQQRILS